MQAPDGLRIDALLAERADTFMARVCRQDGRLAVLASNCFCLYLLLAEWTLTRDVLRL